MCAALIFARAPVGIAVPAGGPPTSQLHVDLHHGELSMRFLTFTSSETDVVPALASAVAARHVFLRIAAAAGVLAAVVAADAFTAAGIAILWN